MLTLWLEKNKIAFEKKLFLHSALRWHVTWQKDAKGCKRKKIHPKICILYFIQHKLL